MQNSAHPFVNTAVSELSLRYYFNVAYVGLGTLPDGPLVKSFESPSVQIHNRPGGNAGGGQLKTWSRTIQEDFALLDGPRVYGREWPLICTDGPGPPRMVSDREGRSQRIGGRSSPTRMIAASVTVTECRTLFDRLIEFFLRRNFAW